MPKTIMMSASTDSKALRSIPYLRQWAGMALLALVLPVALYAQQEEPRDRVDGFSLEVLRKYQANVVDARKLSEEVPTADSTQEKLPVQYGITAQPVGINFKPEPLNAARIARIPVSQLYPGYIRAGYGLYGSPQLDLFYSSTREKEYNYSFGAQHASTQGGVRDIIYEENPFSLNQIEGRFHRFFKDFTWQTELLTQFNRHSYYGVPQLEGLLPLDTANAELFDIWRRRYAFSTGVVENKADAMGPLAALHLDYQNFSDNYFTSENDLGMRSEWTLPVEDLDLQIGAHLRYVHTDFDSIIRGGDSLRLLEQDYLTFQLNPRIEVAYDDFKFLFGFNLFSLSGNFSINDSSISDFRFFPLLQVEYQLVEEVLTAEAGLTGDLQQQTYQSLTADNPYLNPGQVLTPTKTTDFYLGLKGLLSGNTSFGARLGYQRQRDQALMIRQANFFSGSSTPGLDVAYDDVGAFYLQGELQAQFTPNLSLSANAQYRNYQLDALPVAWHLPAFTGRVKAEYLWLEKVKFSTDLQFVGERAVQQINAETKVLEDGSLPAYLNANAGITYYYNTRLSAFIQATNLLNDPYPIYLGFPTQDVNVWFGFTYLF